MQDIEQTTCRYEDQSCKQVVKQVKELRQKRTLPQLLKV